MIHEPQRYVRQLPAFQALEPLLDSGGSPPDAAALLADSGFERVDKALGELAYEAVRRDFHSELPSRLDCLFAFFDPIEAFLFEAVPQDGPRIVCSGRVRSEVRWVIVPMPIPVILPAPSPPDGAGFRQFWTKSLDRARIYWDQDTPLDRVAEVLVEGPIDIRDRYELWGTLIEAGLVLPPNDLSS
jgi:hypothetical protein